MHISRGGAVPVPARTINRRQLLRSGLGAAALAAAGGPLLVACGGTDDATPGASGNGGFGRLDFRLSWIKNVQFVGSYLADSRGYYRAEGFTAATLVPGGPSATPVDADVAGKKALVGVSAPDITAALVAKGGAVRIIGAQFQKAPFAITSMSARPIRTPEEMYGKKIGVQVANELTWNAFLKAAKLDGSKITKVPVQFDPLPLTQGTVDGWFSFATDEPNQLRARGHEVTTFLLADHGYPLVAQTYCVHRDTIQRHRDLLKAFLRAEVHGWRDALADPAGSAELTVRDYGKDLGLDVAEQTLAVKTAAELIQTAETRQHGLFTISPELVERCVATLRLSGLDVTAEQIFDLSILAEVYGERPTLI